ncbi:MAG: DUF4377 domain-containing protein [Rikenellaceae bacterium]|jgi:hypothetical protein|nr:DUF4377 domain-containing protein [Rikenellaceae bacterium]
MKKFLLLMFAAAMLLPACDKGEDYTTKTLIIASEKPVVSGDIMFPPSYYVKESTDGPWEYFYDGIEGFTYVAGFEYCLRVKVYEVKDPPADGSSLRYVCDKVISKVEKNSEGLPIDN